MSVNPVSIASYSFHGMRADGRLDIFGYLELLSSRYRVGHADIWSGFLPTLEQDFLQKIRTELDRRELKVANLCVDGPHLWMDDPAEREAHRELALRYLDAAQTLGAATVRIDMGCADETLTAEAFDYIVKTYSEYAAIAADRGMRVGPENHWGASRVPANLRRVQQAVDHPGYGHLFHFGNFAGDAALGQATVLPYVMHTHVPANMVPQAKGIIHTLQQAGYNGAISVEHHSGALELERVAWQLATVRAILAEIDKGDAGEQDFMSGIYQGKE